MPEPTMEETKQMLGQVTELLDKVQKSNPTGLQQLLESRTPPAFMKAKSESRGFSLHNFLRFVATGHEAYAMHELDTLRRYNKALTKTGSRLNIAPTGWMLPTSFDTYGGQLTQDTESEQDFYYVKSVFENTRPAYDPDEALWLERKRYVKTQSAFEDALGGSVVAPPIQGPVIPLIRPQAAFLAAGATQLTLPPNGRYVAPRITSPPSVSAVGESQDTDESNLGTDQFELTAKKIAGMCRLTEEGTQYTSGTLDNMVQMELGRSLGLKFDAYAFYGPGSSQIPAGLTSNAYNSATNPTGSNIINVEVDYPNCLGVQDPDGNVLLPQYGDILPALVAERSFNMDGMTGAWIVRPSVFATAIAQRASAVTPGDQQGVQVDILRRMAEASPTSWKGRRVVQTTNLRNDRTKGAGTGLSDAFFGIWQYAIMATYGAIQFQTGHDGVSFKRGQYLLRATMYGDVGFQYPPAFLWYSNLMGFGSTNF